MNFKNSAGKDIDHIFQDLATTECMEFDGKLSGALRNNLFMQKHDLAGRNIYRGRDLGIPTYAGLARCFGVDPHQDVRPHSTRTAPLCDDIGRLCTHCATMPRR